MDNNEKTIPENSASRRKFVRGLGIFAVFTTLASSAGLSFFGKRVSKARSKSKSVKMLTEDGRLVEIDEMLVTSQRKKATNADVQHWIKK
ncbi:MAG: hypothetical protein JSU01_20470 [Bacteroidetes bacterium]|nr:hypothetical protein [Bacteroidota bacterium]